MGNSYKYQAAVTPAMSLTSEALEHAAAALAIACNGGAWDTHYHERHKALWRLRVIAAMELHPMTAPADSRISDAMSDEEFMEACRKRAGLREVSATEAYFLLQAEQRIKAHIREKAANGERLDLEQLLIAAYLRGLEWGEENPIDRGYRFKAAGDYADKTLTELRERRAQAVTVKPPREPIGILTYNTDTDRIEITFYEVDGFEPQAGDEVYAAPPSAQAAGVTEEMRDAVEMVLDWWHEWRTEAPEPEEAVAFQALEAALTEPKP